jgi:putative SOS response-associated peptidase YedK
MPVIVRDGAREFATMRWGLVPWWWSKPLKELRMATFNARGDTVAEKPVFREAFQRRRCLMPVSGYYEWQDTPTGKQPYYFTARDGSPILTIAGLWDRWRDRATGHTLQPCAMIITNANDFVGEVHDRMPVLLQPADFDAWLSGAAGQRGFLSLSLSLCR